MTSPEDFIRIWQQSESVKEVSEKTGSSIKNVRERASRYRRNEVPLKKMPMGRPFFDWNSMAKLAQSFLPENGHEEMSGE